MDDQSMNPGSIPGNLTKSDPTTQGGKKDRVFPVLDINTDEKVRPNEAVFFPVVGGKS
jgi:hypothetical protein